MASEGDPCANCGELLAARPGRAPRFCAACGQETSVKPPSLREFAQQFGGAYFSTEGAMWRTLKLLLLKPGELTAQYLAGRRKHYVLPLRLYLTISVLVLLVVRAVGSTGAVHIDISPDNPKTGENFRNFTILGLGEVGQGIGVKDGVFFCNSVPQWVCKRVQRRVSTDPQVLATEIDDFKDRFLGNIGGAMFLMLPTFALGLKLVYLNRRLRYTEHLVFALHVHAFWFFALLFALPDKPWLSGIAFSIVPWYTMRAMKRVYGGRRWPRFLRACTVALLYMVVMALAFSVVMVWTLLA
jgi:hypothetical protein